MSTIESQVLALPVKEQVRVLLDQLPSDCTFEDVQYGLFVLEKIRRGRESIDRGEGIPHEEVERQVKQWLTK
jgi:predicted transcriptional regulator